LLRKPGRGAVPHGLAETESSTDPRGEAIRQVAWFEIEVIGIPE